MTHIQIFYPDSLLVKQILDWVLPVKNTHIDLFEDDDMSRLDIDTEKKVDISFYKDHVTIYIGEAVVIMKRNQYGTLTIF